MSKDVYQEYEDGSEKWVRYDGNGRMVKGWNEKDGNRYYFDPVTGAMAKGTVVVDGRTYRFDSGTGICLGEYQGEVQAVWVLAREEYVDVDDGGGVYEFANYEYDEKSGYLSKVTGDGIKDGPYTTEYERDAQGRTLREVQKSLEGGRIETFYTYDSDGNMTESRTLYYFGENGEVSSTYHNRYEYKNGLLQVEWNANSYSGRQSNRRIEYFYDGKGNCVEEIFYWETDQAQEYRPSSRYVYEYDQSGGRIKISYDWNRRSEEWEEDGRSKETYMYVDNKAYILSYSSLSDGAAVLMYEYERNADGSPKKYTYYSNGEVSFYEVYGQAAPPEEGDTYKIIDEHFSNGRKTTEHVYYYSKLILAK